MREPYSMFAGRELDALTKRKLATDKLRCRSVHGDRYRRRDNGTDRMARVLTILRPKHWTINGSPVINRWFPATDVRTADFRLPPKIARASNGCFDRMRLKPTSGRPQTALSAKPVVCLFLQAASSNHLGNGQRTLQVEDRSSVFRPQEAVYRSGDLGDWIFGDGHPVDVLADTDVDDSTVQ